MSAIAKLIAALQEADPDITADDIADTLWLLLQIEQKQGKTRVPSVPLREVSPPIPPAPNAGISEMPSSQQKSQQHAQPVTENPSMNVYLRSQRSLDKELSSQSMGGMLFRSPAAIALPGALDIERALRPFMRRIPSRTRFVLNVPETVRQIAEVEKSAWLPVWEPAPTRWLEVALVVDEGDSMAPWRQTVAELYALLGHHGAIFYLDFSSEQYEVSLPQEEKQPLSAQQRVRQFRGAASSMAWKLLVLLAASPISFPVIRLIQQALLPEARQVHVAEVFLSGLLEEVSHDETTNDPDYTEYDFLPGVRDVLQRTIPLPDSLQVIEVVSSYLGKRYGQLRNFYALASVSTASGNLPINQESRPFAQIVAKVWRQFGGEYASLAASLEQYFTETHEQVPDSPTTAQQETASTAVQESMDVGSSQDIDGRLDLWGEVEAYEGAQLLQQLREQLRKARAITDAETRTNALTTLLPKVVDDHEKFEVTQEVLDAVERIANEVIQTKALGDLFDSLSLDLSAGQMERCLTILSRFTNNAARRSVLRQLREHVPEKLQDRVVHEIESSTRPERDFFISYTGKDSQWAQWIAFELEAAGYHSIFQAWDIRPGSNL